MSKGKNRGNNRAGQGTFRRVIRLSDEVANNISSQHLKYNWLLHRLSSDRARSLRSNSRI